MAPMTEAELMQAYDWTRYLTGRPRKMLLELLEQGRLQDAREATVRAFLQRQASVQSRIQHPQGH